MKTFSNVIISHLAFLLLFGLATLAFAQESTTTIEAGASVEIEAEVGTTDEDDNLTEEKRKENVEAMRIQAQERVDTNKEAQVKKQAEHESNQEERQVVRDERRVTLEVRTQERITNLSANLSNRLEATITRIQNIIDRIGTRIKKLEERGIDTSASVSALAEAQVSVDFAKQAMVDIDTSVALAVGSEDVRTAWSSVKTTLQTVRDHLKQAHSHLRTTVAELKKAVVEAEVGAGASSAVRADLEAEATE